MFSKGRSGKSIVLITLLAAALLVLAACGGGAGEGTPDEGAGDGGEEAEARVGLVYDVGGRGDESFNDMAYSGLQQASEELGVEVQDLEPSGGGENREELLRTLAEEGYNPIFGVGFLFSDALSSVAADFPETNFAIIDGVVEADNVASLVFREEEGSFLVGAAAALKSETGTVGFIGGQESSLIRKFEAGYAAGARHVNPDIEVLVDYIGTTGQAFNNPTRAEELALAQYESGADIIYHASGASGSGLFSAAVQTDNLAIGVDSDQSLSTQNDDARDHILTSMIKRVDQAVYQTIEDQVNGTFEGGVQSFGLAEDGVGYAVNEYNQDMISDITDQLDDLKQQIIDGEIEVPTEPGS